MSEGGAELSHFSSPLLHQGSAEEGPQPGLLLDGWLHLQALTQRWPWHTPRFTMPAALLPLIEHEVPSTVNVVTWGLCHLSGPSLSSKGQKLRQGVSACPSLPFLDKKQSQPRRWMGGHVPGSVVGFLSLQDKRRKYPDLNYMFSIPGITGP